MIEILEVDPPTDAYPPSLLREQMLNVVRRRQSGAKTPASIRYPLGQVDSERANFIQKMAQFVREQRDIYRAQRFGDATLTAWEIDDLVERDLFKQGATITDAVLREIWAQVGGKNIKPDSEPWSITKKAVVAGGIGLALLLVLRSFGKRAGHMAGFLDEAPRLDVQHFRELLANARDAMDNGDATTAKGATHDAWSMIDRWQRFRNLPGW